MPTYDVAMHGDNLHVHPEQGGHATHRVDAKSRNRVGMPPTAGGAPSFALTFPAARSTVAGRSVVGGDAWRFRNTVPAG